MAGSLKPRPENAGAEAASRAVGETAGPAVKQVQVGDLVVLTEAAQGELRHEHSLWNEDLRPCTLEEHTWPALKFAALWCGMCLSVPVYTLASGMISLGMNWWESVITIFVGSVLVLIPILLVSHAGTRYGIPFPVFARLWFGTRGAHIPALARGLIASGWFGINVWFGCLAFDAILTRLMPAAAASSWHLMLSFAVFWSLNVAVATRGPQAIGRLGQIAAPISGLALAALLLWALLQTGGFGRMLAAPARLHGVEFLKVFYPSVIGVVACWATLSLNIPDFTRHAMTQRGQSWAQALSMPLMMVIVSFAGIAITSATVVLYGQPLWNPVEVLVKFPTPALILGALAVIISCITLNVTANVMAPARAFENLWPRRITFAIGALLTGLIGAGIQPWYVLAKFNNYIFAWLGTYGAMLGPLDGIAIGDYWLVRRRRLNLSELYRRDGIYSYAGGINLHAVYALLIGWGVVLLGLFEPLGFLWRGGWFFGLLGGMLSYWWLMRDDPSLSWAEEIPPSE